MKGNTATVTDTIEKDTSYGDDLDGDGSVTAPSVDISDESGDDVINASEVSSSDISGTIGEGGESLDSLVISDEAGNTVEIDVSTVTVNEDGTYSVENVDLTGRWQADRDGDLDGCRWQHRYRDRHHRERHHASFCIN